MEEFNKLVAQYQCKSSVDVSSSDSESDSDIITSGVIGLNKASKGTKGSDVENGKRKCGPVRLPTRRPDPNVYNRNALLARENRRKKKAHMEALERELDETRSKNRSLMKVLKKQFKLTQKLEKECEYLRSSVQTCKNTQGTARCLSANAEVLSPNIRPVSPDGSLVSTYSNSSYEHRVDSNPLTDLLNVDNDYQPTPEYENENSTRFMEQSSIDLQECQTILNPLNIIDEHSYFNKFSQMGTSPSWEWSSSRTPPSQLLQDDDILDFEDGDYIASL